MKNSRMKSQRRRPKTRQNRKSGGIGGGARKVFTTGGTRL